MWLLIDDVRDIGADVIARTAESGLRLLATLEWEGLYLDHDLGDGATGYDLLREALEAGRVPPQVILVTANPVGRQRMADLLRSTGYVGPTHGTLYRVLPEVAASGASA